MSSNLSVTLLHRAFTQRNWDESEQNTQLPLFVFVIRWLCLLNSHRKQLQSSQELLYIYIYHCISFTFSSSFNLWLVKSMILGNSLSSWSETTVLHVSPHAGDTHTHTERNTFLENAILCFFLSPLTTPHLKLDPETVIICKITCTKMSVWNFLTEDNTVTTSWSCTRLTYSLKAHSAWTQSSVWR